MQLSHVTSAFISSRWNPYQAVRRRGYFYLVSAEAPGKFQAAIALVDNKSFPDSTRHVSAERVFPQLAAEDGALSRQALVRCFSSLFEVAQSADVDEVVIPVHLWSEPMLELRGEARAWGLNAADLEEVVRAAAPAYEGVVVLASLPKAIVDKR